MGSISNVNYIMHVYDEPSPFSDGVIWLKWSRTLVNQMWIRGLCWNEGEGERERKRKRG